MDYYKDIDYDVYLKMLKDEFSDFMILAESGRTSTTYSLKSRKNSIKLRNMLKSFREISIKNDAKLKELKQNKKGNNE